MIKTKPVTQNGLQLFNVWWYPSHVPVYGCVWCVWMSLLLARIKKIKSKMKVLECSQHYTLIFQTLKGKKSPQSVLESGRNSNSYKLLCMSSLPARIIKLEYSKYVVSRRFRAAYSAVRCRSWPKFELIRDLMVVIMTCENVEDLIKKRFTTIFPLNHLGAICCHRNQISDPIWPKTYRSLSPTTIMFQMKSYCDLPAGLSDIQV